MTSRNQLPDLVKMNKSCEPWCRTIDHNVHWSISFNSLSCPLQSFSKRDFRLHCERWESGIVGSWFCWSFENLEKGQGFDRWILWKSCLNLIWIWRQVVTQCYKTGCMFDGWLLQLTASFQAVQVELALDVLSWSRLVVIDWLQSRWERDQATARSQRTQRLLGFLQTCFQSGIRLTSKVNISSENKIPWHKNAQLSKLTKSIIKFYQFLLKWNILLNNSQSTGTCLKYLKV